MMYFLLFLALTLVGIPCILALIMAAKMQHKTNNQKDLYFSDKNEIIKGSIQPNQHPLSTRERPQPTWMN